MTKSQKNPESFQSYIKQNLVNYLLAAIPLVLFAIYLSLIGYDRNIENQIQVMGSVSRLSSIPATSYPIIRNEYLPYVTAQSAIILDDKSQVVLFAKNPQLRFSMASTTKIMTALVALDHYKPQDVLTIYSPDVEGAEVGFEAGEQVYFSDMLYGLLLPSGNDAAYALAENYPGGFDVFIEKMNQKAKSFNLYNTSYNDPAGLNDDGNFTTVQDLSRLASFAIKNKTLADVAKTKNKVITNVAGTKVYSLSNLNKLLGIQGITGLKTGYTQGAGGVLVTSKVEDDRVFIIVVIKSEDRFADTMQLVSYISNNLIYFAPNAN